MALVAVVHVTLASHATVGALCTVVADVDKVRGEPPPVLKVVDVAVMFQPVPEPDASPTSNVCAEVTVWSAPFRVAAKLMVEGLDTKARLPAVIDADAVTAPAPGDASAPHAKTAAAAAVTRTERRVCDRDT
jgi:hypothetical protein